MICPECRTENMEGIDFCANCNADLRGFDHPDVPGGSDRGPDFIYEPLAPIASTLPPGVQVNDPVGLAVSHMQTQNTDAVLVYDGERLAGIITPLDILYKVAGPREDLNARTCGEMMTPDPICLQETDDVSVAIHHMSVGEFRHLPLLREETAVSEVTIADLFSFLAPYLD